MTPLARQIEILRWLSTQEGREPLVISFRWRPPPREPPLTSSCPVEGITREDISHLWKYRRLVHHSRHTDPDGYTDSFSLSEGGREYLARHDRSAARKATRKAYQTWMKAFIPH